MTSNARAAMVENIRTLAMIGSIENPTPNEIGHALLARIRELASGAEPDEANESDVELLIHSLDVAQESNRRHLEWKPPAQWDRAIVRAHLEESSGEALAVDNPLPDELITNAQALGMEPFDLSLWIFDSPRRRDRSVTELTKWARRYGFPNALSGHCGEQTGDPSDHRCRGAQ